MARTLLLVSTFALVLLPAATASEAHEQPPCDGIVMNPECCFDPNAPSVVINPFVTLDRCLREILPAGV